MSSSKEIESKHNNASGGFLGVTDGNESEIRPKARHIKPRII